MGQASQHQSLIQAITDGEMSVLDKLLSSISHTALATSEDPRRLMLWPVLVSPRDPDDCFDMQ